MSFNILSGGRRHPLRDSRQSLVRRRRLHRAGLSLGLVVLLGLQAPLAVASPDSAGELDRLEPRVQETIVQADALRGASAGRAGIMSSKAAEQRFQDLMYLHMIGEHDLAAEGFFALVEVGALTEQGLHRDAEWYLAESLFRMGNLETARSRYQAVADDGGHPFRADAVRRLLEVYAVTGDLERFRTLYRSEIVSGRVAATDLVTYSVGRNFYITGDLLQAKDKLSAVSEGSAFYGRARYFLGTISVVERDLQRAIPFFEEVATLPIEGREDRRVHDLALLALGRIHYEFEDYAQAAEYYSRIGQDSEYAADQLYELVWTFIRTGAWQDALRGIDIYLLAFPEHEYAARLKVVKGKLHMVAADYGHALSSFEEVVFDYAPVRDRLRELASNGATANREYFDEVLAISRAQLGHRRLPQYAVAMILADPDLSRAISVFEELENQERSLRTSEDIIHELRAVLGGSPTLAGADRTRYAAMYTGRVAIEQQLDLLQIEEEWQRSSLPEQSQGTLPQLVERRRALVERAGQLAQRAAAVRAKLDEHQLRMRRLRREAIMLRDEALVHAKQISLVKRNLASEVQLDAEARGRVLDELTLLQDEMARAQGEAESVELRIAQLQAGPDAETDPLVTAEEVRLIEDIDALRLDYSKNRPPMPADDTPRRLDALHVSLARAHEGLQGIHAELDRSEREQLVQVHSAFERVVDEVTTHREELARLLVEAEQVSAGLTRDGFGRLEDFFARSVLDADVGIVDVHWAQKIESTDEIVRVKTERQALMNELDQRFTLIRQKIGN